MAIKLINTKTNIKLKNDGGKVELKPPSMNSYPIYAGDIVVIPKVEKQELETQNTTVKENITIEKIPVSKVSNSAGGNTVVIA